MKNLYYYEWYLQRSCFSSKAGKWYGLRQRNIHPSDRKRCLWNVLIRAVYATFTLLSSHHFHHGRHFSIQRFPPDWDSMYLYIFVAALAFILFFPHVPVLWLWYSRRDVCVRVCACGRMEDATIKMVNLKPANLGFLCNVEKYHFLHTFVIAVVIYSSVIRLAKWGPVQNFTRDLHENCEDRMRKRHEANTL